MKTEVRIITPTVAVEMLKRNVGNRKLSGTHVRFLSNEMVKGNWMFDGQPIRMTTSGAILDGQHRLNAVVNSGTSQKFLIVSGIETEAFKVMDTGKSRSAGDVLGIKGYSNSNSLAAAIRLILSHDRGRNSKVSGDNKISNFDVLSFIEDHQGIVDLASSSLKYYVGFNRVLQMAQIITYRFLFNKKSVVASKDFWSSVCFGLGLEEGHPAKVLRDLLIRDRVSNSTLSASHKKALILKAWNAYRLDKSIKILKWNKDTEKFPELI